MDKSINYNKLLQEQEQIILKHVSAPIYQSNSKLNSLPVFKKKIDFKKTLKKQIQTKQDKESQNINKDEITEKLTKKQIKIYNDE
jgi:hypothetical protein